MLLFSTYAGAADKTVGVIMSGKIPYYRALHKNFTRALSAEGFSQGTVDILLQRPAADALSWTNAARKFVVAEVDVLVTYGAPATLASIRETKGIPIVFAGVYDPAAIGAHARNTTGISSKVPMTSLLKYLKKLVPYTRLAIVYNMSEQDSVRQLEELRRLEVKYGFKTVKIPIKKPAEARNIVLAGKADAVIISVSAVANEAIDTLLAAAQSAKIPAVSQTGGTAEKGVVLSLFASPAEQGKAAARSAARLLKGNSPASIRMEIPRRIELVVNLGAARTLGMKVPFDLITDATRVIK